MVHYLRNDDCWGRNIIDCETTEDDLHVSVGIIAYTQKLWMLSEMEQRQFAVDMENIASLRGEWFESAYYFDKSLVLRDWVEKKIREMAKKWHLLYIED